MDETGKGQSKASNIMRHVLKEHLKDFVIKLHIGTFHGVIQLICIQIRFILMSQILLSIALKKWCFFWCFVCTSKVANFNMCCFGSVGNATDVLAFAKELSSIGGDTQPVSAWAMGHNDSWPNLKTSLKSVAVEFASLSDKYLNQVC